MKHLDIISTDRSPGNITVIGEYNNIPIQIRIAYHIIKRGRGEYEEVKAIYFEGLCPDVGNYSTTFEVCEMTDLMIYLERKCVHILYRALLHKNK